MLNELIKQATVIPQPRFMRDNLETIVKGVGGTAASIGSTFVSLLPQVETVLRITSLLVGIAVGLLTFCVLYRSWRKRK